MGYAGHDPFGEALAPIIALRGRVAANHALEAGGEEDWRKSSLWREVYGTVYRITLEYSILCYIQVCIINHKMYISESYNTVR